MSLATKKEEQAIHECYRRLFRASTPSANFDELIQNASENELGEKVIDYNNYEICEYQFSEIIQEVIKEYEIKTWRRQLFKNAIILGCSPKFKNPE